MPSNFNASLRVNNLNLSPGNSNLAGLNSGWSNNYKGDNLYSPTIFPFYTGIIDLTFSETGVGVEVETDTESDLIAAIPLGKNIMAPNPSDSSNPFTLMYKTIEIFVCTVPASTQFRYRRFVYKTQLSIALGGFITNTPFYGIRTDSTVEKEIQQETYAPSFLPAPIDLTLGNSLSGLVQLRTSGGSFITPPGNQGPKTSLLAFDNLDSLIVNFRLRIAASTTLYNSGGFNLPAAFKGYIKLK